MKKKNPTHETELFEMITNCVFNAIKKDISKTQKMQFYTKNYTINFDLFCERLADKLSAYFDKIVVCEYSLEHEFVKIIITIRNFTKGDKYVHT